MTQNAQIARIGGDTTALVRPANVDALLESVDQLIGEGRFDLSYSLLKRRWAVLGEHSQINRRLGRISYSLRIGVDMPQRARPPVRDHRPCTGTSHWTQAFAYFDWPIPVAKGDEIVQLDFSQSAAELTYLSTRSAARQIRT